MKKAIYTILSIVAIAYIALLAINVVAKETAWDPAFVNQKWFDIVLSFGGVAIIFCFALVNFAGSPLKTVFFILLIVAVIAYIVVLAAPDFLYKLFGGNSASAVVEKVRLLF